MFQRFSDPLFLKAFHGWCTTFWLPFTVAAYFMGWLESVIFVSIVSMIALFLGSFSSWQASRTEVVQLEMTSVGEKAQTRLRRRMNPKLKVSRQLRMRRLGTSEPNSL